MQPDLALSYRKRGHAYFLSGQGDKALLDFEQYLELEPDSRYRPGLERRIEQLQAQ
jgi:regulator of sirC expression with transglutaminase-like and TPR domain